MEENRKLTNGESILCLVVAGCAVYGVAKLTDAIIKGTVNASIWAGKKIINVCKKK